MPRPLGVPSLLSQSLGISGQCLYKGLVNDGGCVSTGHEGSIRDRKLNRFFGCQPHLIASLICKDVLNRYVNHWRNIIESSENLLEDTTPPLPSVANFLSLIISPNLTQLDLSGMIRLGRIDKGTTIAFKASLCEALQHAPNLTKLCLKTSSNACRTKTFLPVCDDDVLVAISLNCKELVTLDISYNQEITVAGLTLLAVRPDVDISSGCPKLKSLFLFDCHLHPKQLATILPFFAGLTEFGCKMMGNILITLLHNHEGKGLPVPQFKFTALNNVGARSNKHTLNSLRGRQKIVDAFLKTNPEVSNLKLRVHDNDVEYLSNLKCLDKVELLFNSGMLHSPGDGTRNFLLNSGFQLTSLTIISNRLNATNLETIGMYCPAMKGLWLRCNEFVYPTEEDVLQTTHTFFKNLLVLYFRIGEVMTSMCNLRHDILPYLLCNGQKLEELYIAVRTPMVCGPYITRMLQEFRIMDLTKLAIVVPGLNNLPKVIEINREGATEIIYRLPKLKSLGNLISWQVTEEEYFSICKEFKDTELEIVRKVSVFR